MAKITILFVKYATSYKWVFVPFYISVKLFLEKMFSTKIMKYPLSETFKNDMLKRTSPFFLRLAVN